jgi:hypothetical protein
MKPPSWARSYTKPPCTLGVRNCVQWGPSINKDTINSRSLISGCYVMKTSIYDWCSGRKCPRTGLDPRQSLRVQAMNALVQGATSAPMWLDGASMGVPFSSLPAPGLTKAANSGLTHLPTFSLPAHAPWPPPSTTYLPTRPPIFLLTHQPIYLCTYALNLHQGNDNTSLLRILQYTR